jgi:hypothetical protein
MIGRALGEGIRSATRRPGLVTTLWAWNLALTLLAAMPFWAWVSTVSSVSPATDAFLDGLNIGLMTHLVAAEPNAFSMIATAVAILALTSLLSGAFLSGGILEIVTTEPDGRRLLHRFFGGAGRFFGRFVRLLAIAGLTLGVVMAIVATTLGAATRALASGGNEPRALFAAVILQVAVGLTIGFFVLALDYARVMTVLSGSGSMARTWWRALLFVVRRTPGVATIGLLAAICVLGAMAMAAAFDIAYGARTWGVIVGAVVVHQAMVVVRTAVRVGQLSAQARYCRDSLPAPAPPAVDVPESAPPTVEPLAEPDAGPSSPLPE